eukprot:TRINITY_DN2662_c0_g1_i6.p1 TRINITY_DN2662_c0_g1~~TRINITY_DN2662_c0_g1_i6.p1  ORF type:complete len:904 (-),score=189.72 TRINITY_DN2662_c0_g1_i6:46-2757(-)
MEPYERALQLKEEGNKYYKGCNYSKAIECYTQACNLCPTDPVFSSNISAALFEQGKYDQVIESVDSTLSIVQEDNFQLKQKLLLRKIKSLLLSKRFEEGRSCLQTLFDLCNDKNLPITEEYKTLGEAFEHGIYSLLNIEKATANLLSVPKFRPCLETMSEYFVVGNDAPVTAFCTEDEDKENANNRIWLSKVREPVSVFFGGIGDARHLFATIVDAARQINALADKSKVPTLHFTMVDHMAAVIARDLVILTLLQKLADFKPEERGTNTEALKITAVLEYTYLGNLMPNYLHDILHQTLLELDKQIVENKLPDWIILRQNDIPLILAVLRYWHSEVKYSAKDILKAIEKLKSESNEVFDKAKEGKIDLPTGAKNILDAEKLIAEFNQLPDEFIATLPGEDTVAEKRARILKGLEDESIRETMLQSRMTSKGNTLEYLLYKKYSVLTPPDFLMDQHKEFVPIIEAIQKGGLKEEDDIALFKHIALGWKPNPTVFDKEWVSFVGEVVHDYNAYEISRFLANNIFEFDQEAHLFENLQPYFIAVADSLSVLKSFVRLEWIVGDLVNTLQAFAIDKERPRINLPVTFDRILMSNVPDYVGGNLTTFLYAMPQLKANPHSFVRYNVMLNNGMFKDIAQNVKAYTLLPNLESHIKFFGVEYVSGELWGGFDVVWRNYPTPLPQSMLVTNDEIVYWLTQIFFYIVLPKEEEDVYAAIRVDYPLNLVNFMELIRHLVKIGYPPHWFANFLSQLLSGSINTTVRPPPHLLTKNSLRTVSLQPFLNDLEFAVSLYLPILNFSIPFPKLPVYSSFQKYTIQLPPIMKNGMGKVPIMALLFSPRYNESSFASIREEIVGGTSRFVLISIWSLHGNKSRASFWMNSTRYEKMKQQGTYVYVVRLDSYRVVSNPTKL